MESNISKMILISVACFVFIVSMVMIYNDIKENRKQHKHTIEELDKIWGKYKSDRKKMKPWEKEFLKNGKWKNNDQINI